MFIFFIGPVTSRQVTCEASQNSQAFIIWWMPVPVPSMEHPPET